jgi:hypothetical protein
MRTTNNAEVNTMKKVRKLAVLPAEENKVWESTFAFYVEDKGMSDMRADIATWRDMQEQFPRLRAFSGCKAGR